MTKQLKMGIGLILASMILLIGVIYFSRAGIRRSINHFRAERLYSQAQEAFAAEAWGDAVQKGRAAHYLDVENTDIQLLVARALLYQRNSNTIEWWKRILNKPDLPVEDLRKVTKTLLVGRMYDEALPFLERLVELDSNNPETQNLWLTALQAQRSVSNTRALVNTLVEKGTDDWEIHQRYMSAQQATGNEAGPSQATEHLLSLIQEGGDLALLAARELALRKDATSSDRLAAARYLENNGEDQLDQLVAAGLQVKENQKDASILPDIVDGYLESNVEDCIPQALQWSLWMGLPQLILDRVDWQSYRDASGTAELYFQALLQTRRFQQLLEITQQEYRETDADAIIFLAYRASAQRRLGMEPEAVATLQHAIDVVDPEKSAPLERFLLVEGQWEMLVDLYEKLVEEDPDDIQLLYRYLAALYYTGKQDRLEQHLDELSLDLFDGQVSAQSFVCYLKLVVLGFDPELHTNLESLMSKYPEVYDFRLIVGLSYLLQGKPSIAASFVVDMPELTLSAPRHLRVCAALLHHSMDNRFGPHELEYLMPRERFLLSKLPSK